MESLRDLFIRLGLSVDGASFAEGLAWEHALEKAGHLVVEAVHKIAEVFVEAIAGTAEYGEQMVLLSDKTGVGVEQIQKLGYAASLSGSSAEGMQSALVHLARTSQLAKDGNEKAVESFNALGISMHDVRSKTPDQLFLSMSDKIKKLGNTTKVQAGAFDLLGRSGVELIPMMKDGAKGIKELGEEADAAGVIMSEEAAHKAQDFGDNITRLQKDAQGLTGQFAGPLIDALDPIVVGFHEWFIENRKLIGQKVEAFAKVLVSVIQDLSKAVGWAYDHWALLVVILGSATAAMAAFAAGAIWAAISTAAAWLWAVAPVILLAAAFTIAALAAQDFYVYLQGGDSVMGSLGVKWAKFIEDWSRPKSGDNWLVSVLRDCLHWILNLEQEWDRFEKSIDKIKEVIGFVSTKDSDAEAAQKAKTHAAIAANATPEYLRSPGNDAAASVAAAPKTAASFYAPVNITQKEGQSAGDLADHLTGHFERLWDSKMREAAPVAGK